VITVFSDPAIKGPLAIAAGPDGNMWFTNWGTVDLIGRISPNGIIATYASGVAYARDIAAGFDNDLWYPAIHMGLIGRITTVGSAQVFDVGFRPPVGPSAVAAGPDGNIWMLQGGERIGKRTPDGTYTWYSTRPMSFGYWGSITTGPDGNLWFVGGTQSKVGRMTPEGAGTTFSFTGEAPVAITPGPDGHLWFVGGSGTIGRVTTAGAITLHSLPGALDLRSVVSGPDGNLWFTSFGNQRIGRFTLLLTPPSAPLDVAATAASGEATVSWTPPLDDGDVALTEYTVTASPGGATCSATPPTTTCTVTGLTNGTTYTFTVVATNTVGEGPASLPSNAVTPVGLPGAPYFTGVGESWSGAGGWLSPIWGPTDDGGSPIQGFVAETDQGQSCTASGDDYQCTISGLTNGVWYMVRVRAWNAVGDGPWTAWLGPFVPRGVATVPRQVVGVPMDGAVQVSWTPPENDGGWGHVWYTVTADPGGATCTEDWPFECTVSGLTNGTPYTFTVTTLNVGGVGPPSAPSRLVRPHGAAPAPSPAADVPDGAWFEVAVDWAYENLITTGMGGTPEQPSDVFGPDEDVTRAQMVTFLHRMADAPTGYPASPASDVPDDAYYEEAVNWAYATGVTYGIGGSAEQPSATFGPDLDVTRAQMVAFLHRLSGLGTGSPVAPFTDVERPSFYAEAADWAFAHTITTGVGGTPEQPSTTFAPTQVVDRAQMVTFLHRLAMTPAAWSLALLPSIVQT
jgi:streptogramin lyase